MASLNPFDLGSYNIPELDSAQPKSPGLMSNPLFLQYLGAAGQDIGSGNPIGTNVNAVTQNTIGAKSKANLHAKYLKSLLSGEMPANMKLSMDRDGASIKIPRSELGELVDIGGSSESFNTPKIGSSTTNTSTAPGNLSNPFL
jgi:hypothetical protein